MKFPLLQMLTEMFHKEDLYEMVNLFPAETRLPGIYIWMNPKGNAKHDARIKIMRNPSDRNNYVSIAIRPSPHLVHPSDAKKIRAHELTLVYEWINLNSKVLIDFWDYKIIQTSEFLNKLKPLP